MDANGSGENRKSYDFRMSKKVAELTQVVHMLFTRNHEKEVEMEALRDAYEYEIELIQKDARQKLEVLEAGVHDLERQKSGAKSQASMEQAMAAREDEWKKALAEKEGQLQWEKQECQNARDLLIRAQNDIERLKDVHNNTNRKLSDEITSKNQEIKKLKNLITNLESQLHERESDKDNTVLDLQRERDKLQKTYTDIKEAHDDLKKTNDRLQDKIRQCEQEIRTLKAELAKRASSASQPKEERRPIPSASFMDYSDELERLRKELQLCKMELTNREHNFNRMFTDKQPVLVSAGSAKKQEGLYGEPVRLRMSRQKTFHGESVYSAMSSGSAEHTDMMAISPRRMRASSGGNTLPQLHLDAGRLQKLIKPRPLPKEFLSTKSTGQS